MFFLEYAHASYLCEMSADPPDEYVSPWHLLMFKLEIDLAAQIGHCQLGKNPVIANLLNRLFLTFETTRVG